VSRAVIATRRVGRTGGSAVRHGRCTHHGLDDVVARSDRTVHRGLDYDPVTRGMPGAAATCGNLLINGGTLSPANSIGTLTIQAIFV